MNVTPPPRWLFTILAGGGLWASGVYLGLSADGGATTATVIKAIVYGAFGLVMLWGALGKR
ncbi:MAG: hypothetical protein ISR91_03145 [Candidatus Delongbacteria bacterium]|nr:hypothetical protein [bacterium]MBL7033118.1 hypothetical protein [Candidatus Delongbacteria bacterium]